jgi:hypothetical protein
MRSSANAYVTQRPAGAIRRLENWAQIRSGCWPPRSGMGERGHDSPPGQRASQPGSGASSRRPSAPDRPKSYPEVDLRSTRNDGSTDTFSVPTRCFLVISVVVRPADRARRAGSGRRCAYGVRRCRWSVRLRLSFRIGAAPLVWTRARRTAIEPGDGPRACAAPAWSEGFWTVLVGGGGDCRTARQGGRLVGSLSESNPWIGAADGCGARPMGSPTAGASNGREVIGPLDGRVPGSPEGPGRLSDRVPHGVTRRPVNAASLAGRAAGSCAGR